MTTSAAIGKTAIWLFFNLIFGLVQYFILLGGDWLGFEEYSAQETIAEGVITFFCAALMASTAVDLMLAKPPYPEAVKFSLYVLPCLVFMDVIFIYGQLHFNQQDTFIYRDPSTNQNVIIHPQDTFNYRNLSINQSVIIGIALVYCVWIKILTFMEEKP